MSTVAGGASSTVLGANGLGINGLGNNVYFNMLQGVAVDSIGGAYLVDNGDSRTVRYMNSTGKLNCL